MVDMEDTVRAVMHVCLARSLQCRAHGGRSLEGSLGRVFDEDRRLGKSLRVETNRCVARDRSI